eukprot:30183-Pelagococcus_subviridis.AAC.2
MGNCCSAIKARLARVRVRAACLQRAKEIRKVGRRDPSPPARNERRSSRVRPPLRGRRPDAPPPAPHPHGRRNSARPSSRPTSKTRSNAAKRSSSR